MTYVNAFCLTIKGISSLNFSFRSPLLSFVLCRFQQQQQQKKNTRDQMAKFFFFPFLFFLSFHLYVKSRGADLDVEILLDMSTESVGLLSSPSRSNSPLLTEPILDDYEHPIAIFDDSTNSYSHQVRSPSKRQLTIEDSLITTNDPKRLCHRYEREGEKTLTKKEKKIYYGNSMIKSQ